MTKMRAAALTLAILTLADGPRPAAASEAPPSVPVQTAAIHAGDLARPVHRANPHHARKAGRPVTHAS